MQTIPWIVYFQDAFLKPPGQNTGSPVGLAHRYKDFNVEKSRHLSDLRFQYEYLDIKPPKLI